MSRIVITGAAGFIGSHLSAALLSRGDEVIGVDNLSTGSRRNVDELIGESNFTLHVHDITDGFTGVDLGGGIDGVFNLASPASPPQYFEMPVATLRVGSAGTEAALGLATEHGARFVQASTSEVYGDPEEHPQTESYWGHVNPIGLRSCYDEAKRYGEAITMAYRRSRGTRTAIVRIFNTYGPHLDPEDGRVVSNLLAQALTGRPLTIYGDGSQTRSFCFVDDLVAGLIAMYDSDHSGPVNLGNPVEFTMLELVDVVREVTGGTSEIVFAPLPADDPTQRQPDISLAREVLGWEPAVALREGLERTVIWYRKVLGVPS